jgi:hypothetical protein
MPLDLYEFLLKNGSFEISHPGTNVEGLRFEIYYHDKQELMVIYELLVSKGFHPVRINDPKAGFSHLTFFRAYELLDLIIEMKVAAVVARDTDLIQYLGSAETVLIQYQSGMNYESRKPAIADFKERREIVKGRSGKQQLGL